VLAHFHYGQGPALFLDLLQRPLLLLGVFSPYFMSPTRDAHSSDGVWEQEKREQSSLTNLFFFGILLID
jgi:hypothetical protein